MYFLFSDSLCFFLMANAIPNFGCCFLLIEGELCSKPSSRYKAQTLAHTLCKFWVQEMEFSGVNHTSRAVLLTFSGF